MKTSFITSKVAAAGMALLLSASLASSAFAGPGLEYWRSIGKPAAPADEPAKPAVVAAVCSESEIVPIMTMRPSWHNGRGPLVPTQIGTERVCHVCKTTKLVITNDWPNHRGPLVKKTEVTKTGAAHTCTMDCTQEQKDRSL